jgi:major type 1 subunit fimbrin (pilin)
MSTQHSALIPHSSALSPQSSVRGPQSAIPNPQSAIRNPQSAIPNPQSAIRNPQSAIRNPLSSRAGAGAFTLLEVLLAMTIFAVCVSALYNTFRVSTRAFETGRESAEMMQTLRFSLEIVVRDLKSIRFQDKYDQKFQFLERLVFQHQEQILRDLNDGKPVSIPGLISHPQGEAENMKDFVGLRANLRFVGSSSGEAGVLEFSHCLPSDGTTDNSYLGAERVKYFVANNNLYRQRSRVFCAMELNPGLGGELVKIREASEAARQQAADAKMPFLDFWALGAQGTLPPQLAPPVEPNFFVEVPQPPEPPELIARNVTVFDLTYGYYADGDWKEAESWDSDAKQYRTPPFDFQTNDPLFGPRLSSYQNRSNDNLPSYVKIRVRMQQQPGARKEGSAGRKSGNLAREIETTVWVPGAIETYVPQEYELFRSGATGPAPGTRRPVTR